MQALPQKVRGNLEIDGILVMPARTQAAPRSLSYSAVFHGKPAKAPKRSKRKASVKRDDATVSSKPRRSRGAKRSRRARSSSKTDGPTRRSSRVSKAVVSYIECDTSSSGDEDSGAYCDVVVMAIVRAWMGRTVLPTRVCNLTPDDYIKVTDPRTKAKAIEEMDILLTDAATLLSPSRQAQMRVESVVDLQTRTRKEWRADCSSMNTNVVTRGTVLREALFQVCLQLSLVLPWCGEGA